MNEPEIERRQGADDRRHRTTTELWLPSQVVVVSTLIACFITLTISLFTILLVSNQTNDGFRQTTVTMCDGTNMLRGFARLATNNYKPKPPDNRRLADFLLRIRDCEATFDNERVVHVSDAVEVRYLTALSQHKRVAIRNGKDLIVLP